MRTKNLEELYFKCFSLNSSVVEMNGTYTLNEGVREQEKIIVVNQMRGFIAALYKFFCESSPCDWKTVFTELNIIRNKTERLIQELSDHQNKILFSYKENEEEVDTSYFLRAADTEDDEDYSRSSRSRNRSFGATFSRSTSQGRSPNFGETFSRSGSERRTPNFGATFSRSTSQGRSPNFGATFSRPATSTPNSRPANSTASRPKSAMNYTLPQSRNAGRTFQDHRRGNASEGTRGLFGAAGNLRRFNGTGLLDLS